MHYKKLAFLAVLGAVLAPMSAAFAHEDKHPNISGIWEAYPDLYADDAFLELPPPNGGADLKEPYASQWKAFQEKREAAFKAGTPIADGHTLCRLEGMPLLMGAIMAIEILQTPKQVTVLGEFLAQTRRIYLDKKMPEPGDLPPYYNGYSVGHWEGDTLVITTRGVREDVTFFDIPHSSDMTITERIRLTGPNLLENQIVIDDPKILAKPYRFTYGYKRNDDYEIKEYYCDPADSLITVGSDGKVEMNLDP